MQTSGDEVALTWHRSDGLLAVCNGLSRALVSTLGAGRGWHLPRAASWGCRIFRTRQEWNSLVDTGLRVRRRRAMNKNAEAALRYAALGWPVCPGEFPAAGGQRAGNRQRACSCDRIGCPAPGAHPVSPAWQSTATSAAELISTWWLATPQANVILVTGRTFDVLDAPGPIGMTALARMERSGLRPGPVAMSTAASSTGGVGAGERAHFYVRTRGAPADENEWWSCHLDCEPEEVADVTELRWHCRNSYVMAPPSTTGTGVACRWLRDPRAHELPDGLALLEILSDVCEEASSW